MTPPEEDADRRLSCSIIICTKDRRADLGRCLDSIVRQIRLPDELVVVDAGSDDAREVVDAFAARFGADAVRYVRSEPGLTRQRNLGVEASKAKILHFLDDDAVLDAAYVAEIQQVFEAPGMDDIVAVSPMVRVPDPLSRSSWLVRRIFLLPQIKGDGRLLPSGFGAFPWNADALDVREIRIACGICAYRREVFDRIRFDPFFDGYGYMEDLDFSVRAAKLGRVLLNPRAIVTHVESPASRPNRRRLAAMQTTNHHYFFRKNMPQDFYHRLCFWWSDLGDAALKLAYAARHLDWELAAGVLSGHWAILRGRSQQGPVSPRGDRA